MQILIYISIGIVIGYIGYRVLGGGNGIGERVVVSEKEDREEKILGLIEEKGRVKNGDIQELLGVADSTATKYLQQLEDAEKIKQEGEAGRFVYYSLR